jgi:phosphoribosyl 1,2-cyclic phosphodiesterase
MIKFTSIASSSQGNAYVASSTLGVASPLLLEAGLTIKKLRGQLGFPVTDLIGCLISHEHMDHARAVPSLLRAGIDCYMSAGTALTFGPDLVTHHLLHIVEANRRFAVGAWQVMPIRMEHDAAEPLGYYISLSDGDNDGLLFLPDTSFVVPRFNGITLLAIECNHNADLLLENVTAGNLPRTVAARIRRNHLNVANVVEFLKANDLSRCREIHLMHLSDTNSNERQALYEIMAATGIETFVC